MPALFSIRNKRNKNSCFSSVFHGSLAINRRNLTADVTLPKSKLSAGNSGSRCCTLAKMMKDDAPSPWLKIFLTGGFHRPCQFEHEITNANGTAMSWDRLWEWQRRWRKRDRGRRGWWLRLLRMARMLQNEKGKTMKRQEREERRQLGRKWRGWGINYCHSSSYSVDPAIAGFALYVTTRQYHDNP